MNMINSETSINANAEAKGTSSDLPSRMVDYDYKLKNTIIIASSIILGLLSISVGISVFCGTSKDTITALMPIFTLFGGVFGGIVAVKTVQK